MSSQHIQTTATVLMIRPNRFRFNDQTAINNFYQRAEEAEMQRYPEEKAMGEFNNLIQVLADKGIEVHVLDTPAELDTPDAVFPNNWVSFHEGKRYVLYSMFAPNRRLERNIGLNPRFFPLIQDLREVYSFAPYEAQNRFLEGTGSLVLDRVHKIAFAAISERTDDALVREFGRIMEYQVVLFRANQTKNDQRLPIYHTNVMMSIGSDFAWICDASIDDSSERSQVMKMLSETGREIISITEKQTNTFAGNLLELRNKNGDKFVVMSDQAFESLNSLQISALKKYVEILHVDLGTIEALGGGSARCMIAEIFR